MKKRDKGPFIAPARCETIRHNIASLLDGHTLSAREISQDVRISEKEVYEHLEHILRSVSKSEKGLVVTPAECRACGFVFSKRERLKKPGKCPLCKNESIMAPLFSIEERG